MAAEETMFREVILFLDDIGVYDVVLPFLLIFTIVFAILEKTRLFGTDEIQGQKFSKKNINAMVAFVSSFLVVASTELVATVNTAVSHIMLLLLLIVLFLMLIATFQKEGDEVELPGWVKITGGIVLFIGVLLIFLNALGWLDNIGDFFVDNIDEPWFVSIIMIIVLALIIAVIIGGGKPTAVSGGTSPD